VICAPSSHAAAKAGSLVILPGGRQAGSMALKPHAERQWAVIRLLTKAYENRRRSRPDPLPRRAGRGAAPPHALASPPPSPPRSRDALWPAAHPWPTASPRQPGAAQWPLHSGDMAKGGGGDHRWPRQRALARIPGSRPGRRGSQVAPSKEEVIRVPAATGALGSSCW